MPNYRIEFFRRMDQAEPSMVYLYGAADEADAEWFARQGAIFLDAEIYAVNPDSSRPPLPRGQAERLWPRPEPVPVPDRRSARR